ncbi:sugar transporter [Salipiger sp. IMCC34102]|uniref:sugar transporter n=1 Tax=Salipiger sp. IMCC34102 TaxID=2510647 RepID=UPI00101DCCCE|nr:sugar transporter [Salipiger sp. IMCC34102]RYH03063.1 sugar transporter [Salipiger sp. IMCC34102]
MIDVNDQVNLLLDQIDARRADKDRMLVAVCGAPASGKTTLARELCRRLNLRKIPALVVPMDGFHLDNAVLEARDLQHRKGAPETFDADGFLHLVRRLSDPAEVIAPMFDRTRDLSVAGAIAVPASCPIVIVEGNYLMFEEPPWEYLAPLWDLTVRIEVPMPQLRARLIHRWLALNHSRAAATRRAESNDILNAQRVIDHALPCEITLSSPET